MHLGFNTNRYKNTNYLKSNRYSTIQLQMSDSIMRYPLSMLSLYDYTLLSHTRKPRLRYNESNHMIHFTVQRGEMDGTAYT